VITLSENVVIPGVLEIGSVPDVENELNALGTKIHNLEVEAAATTAAEAAVEAALAALEAASFLKPPGYSALPEETPPETDPNSTSVDPLTLAPAGNFQGVDAFGAITHTTVARGKVGVNNTFPLRSLDLKGDIRQQATDANDIVELQSLCRLASHVATYDTSNNLTNPTAAAVYLGSNALVDCSGTLQAEGVNVTSVNSTSIRCSDINRTNVVRTLHAAQAPTSKDYGRDVAIQSIRTSAALRLAAKPTLARDYTVPLANIRGALTQVLRRIKPMLSRDFTEDIQRLRVEAAVDRRELYRPLPLSKDFTPEIVELKQALLASSEQHKPVNTHAADFRLSLKRLSDRLVAVQRLIKPVLAASYSTAIAVLKQLVAVNTSDIKALKKKHDPLQPDLRPALAKARAQTIAVQRCIKPSLSKLYDKQIAAVRQSITATSSRFNTSSLSLGSGTSSGWLTIGSFTDTFVGTIAVTFDHASNVTYNDSLRVDITYHRTGDQIAVTATRGGNAAGSLNNSSNTNGLSGLYVTNVAQSAAGTVHTVNVYYGYIDSSNGIFKVGTEVKAGNFTLASPMVYGNITFATADPGYMDCMEGHNSSSMFLHGTATIDSAIMDKCQVAQLTGLAQSMLNVPANSTVKIGTVSSSFQGTVRIIMSNTATLPAITHAVTLVINQIETDAKPVITMRHHANAVVRVSPAQGIQTVYFTGSNFTGVSVKTGSVACNLYVSALNSDPLVSYGNAFSGDDGWYQEMTVITQPTGAYELTVNSNSPTVYCNDVNMLGSLNVTGGLTHTGSSLALCQVNTGNFIEMACAAGSTTTPGSCLIDFHAGLSTDNVDYNARIYVANNQFQLTAANGLYLTNSALAFGSRTGALINLWGGVYTIGIQGGTQYYRTDQHFAWYKGGTHSDTILDSGGGNTIAYLDGNAYEMFLRGGTGQFTKVVRSTKNIVMSGNVSASSTSSGTINFGITFTSPPIVTLTIDDAGGTVAAIYVAGRSTTGCSWSASNSGTSNRSINWIAHGNSTQ
jgi:hypothetical protein